MISYSDLYEPFISDENIKLAIVDSSEDKRDRPLVRVIYENPDLFTPAVKTYARNFHNEYHKPVQIYDGIKHKKREIIVPRYKEQIVHHMFIQIMEPIIMRGMYAHSYASVPGRGSTDGAAVIKKWIRDDPKGVKYCLKMDIYHFYPSIDLDILRAKLEKTIRDRRFLNVGLEIISATTEGLPLGFYPSPWLANWLLQPLDYFITQELHAPHFMRYADDMVIFSSNKRQLAKFRERVSEYLEKELHLRLRPDWQIFRFDYITTNRETGERIHKGRPLDYMGFVFYRDRTILREAIMLNASRLARRIAKQEKPTIYSLKRMMAYKGYIEHTDTYGMYLEHIKPFVTFQYCQRRISKYDKRRNNQMKNWTKTRSTVKPESIDATSSQDTVYVRKNIVEVEVGEGDQKVTMYEYDEKKMTREEFVAYADLIDTAMETLNNRKSIEHNRADIDFLSIMAEIDL